MNKEITQQKDETKPAPLTTKQIIWFLVSTVVYVILRVIPIAGLSPEGQKALAVLGWVIVALISECLPSMLITLIFGSAIIVSGVLTPGQFLTAFGTSPFILIVGLGAVGMGMTRTNLGARMSYLMMKYIGKTPRLMVLAIMIVGFVIVALIVNLPALLAMCPVIISILKELDEDPETSNLGKAMFLGLIWAGAGGGLALISSSATTVAAAAAIDTVSEGVAAISYGQWAVFGIPIGLAMLIPAWLLLCKWFKIEGKGAKVMEPEVLNAKIKEMGRMNAEEMRYALILVAMIALFAVGGGFGITPPVVALIFMGIMIMPYIGVITFDVVQKNTNWAMCFQMAFFMGFAGAISGTGLGDWLAGTLFGWFQTDNLFILMLAVILIAHIGNIVIPGAGASILLIPSVWAISVNAGYANSFLPMVLFHVVNWTQFQPIQPQYLVVCANSGGYLKIRDFVVPNLIITVIWTVLFIPLAWFLGPIAGLR